MTKGRGTTRDCLKQLRQRIDQWFFANPHADDPASVRRSTLRVPSTEASGDNQQPKDHQPEEDAP